MAYQQYQGPGMAGLAPSREFLWQVFQRFDTFVISIYVISQLHILSIDYYHYQS